MTNTAAVRTVETHIADIRLGKTPREQLGNRIHVIDNPVAACPVCAHGGPVQVFAAAVRWPCGHTRSVPPISIDCYPGCVHNRAARLQRARMAMAEHRRLRLAA